MLRLALILVIVTSCGKEDKQKESCTAHGDSCSSQTVITEKGDTGAAGSNGKDAAPCTVTQVPEGAVVTCPNQPAVTIRNGLVGPTGAAGQPGTVITPVKLCPGTPVYPSVFIEVAECIDSRLYAVYSANGGFLTEIPPGQYSSNAIGSRCDFTVLPDCQIQN